MKRAIIAAVIVAAWTIAGLAQPVVPPTPGRTPQISAEGRKKLCQMLRAEAARWLDREHAGPACRRAVPVPEPFENAAVPPPELTKLQLAAAVALRIDGRLLGKGQSRPLPVAKAVLEALHQAMKSARRNGKTLNRHTIENMHVSIQLLGPLEKLPRGKSPQPKVKETFRLGVDGLYMQRGNKEAYLLPTETFEHCLKINQMLRRLIAQVRPERPLGGLDEKIQLYRFRTLHWVQSRKSAEPIVLVCGMQLVPIDFTCQELDKSVDMLLKYLLYRQNSDGSFSYEYNPCTDTYSEENCTIRQVGACWGLAWAARRTGSEKLRRAAKRAIERLLKETRWLDKQKTRACIWPAGESDATIGATGLMVLSMLDVPQADAYRPVRDALAEALLAQQRSDGLFLTTFGESTTKEGIDYYPGECLLALARMYEATGRERYLQAIQRAFEPYRQYFRRSPKPPFVPWQSQAYAVAFRATRQRRYAEYIFEMTDWMLKCQIKPGEGVAAERVGGFAPFAKFQAGCGSCAYMEGIVEALAVAKMAQDATRIARYTEAVRLGSRFLMQLQVRPAETYFSRFPTDAVGGIRQMPGRPLLRIDNVQHTLHALTRAREELFGRRNFASRVEPARRQ